MYQLLGSFGTLSDACTSSHATLQRLTGSLAEPAKLLPYGGAFIPTMRFVTHVALSFLWGLVDLKSIALQVAYRLPYRMAEHYEVREYLTEDDRSPFAEWLDGLRDRRTRARIAARLARVRLGNLGDYDAVGEGVHELRIFYGPGYRVYFGFASNTIVVLLSGGTKASQRRDIATAQAYWHDYRSRDDG